MPFKDFVADVERLAQVGPEAVQAAHGVAEAQDRVARATADIASNAGQLQYITPDSGLNQNPGARSPEGPIASSGGGPSGDLALQLFSRMLDRLDEISRSIRSDNGALAARRNGMIT